MKVYFICSVCGSSEVHIRGWIKWDAETQKWVVVCRHESHTSEIPDWCNNCEEHQLMKAFEG